MLNLTAAARPYFSLLRRRRAAYADAGGLERVQRRLLERLLFRARRTEVIREAKLSSAATYRDFADALPVVEYEDIRPRVMRMLHGEPDVLWPGITRRYAQSSGTSGGKSKYIPVTDHSLRHNHYPGAAQAVATYLGQRPRGSRLFGGSSLILGGSFANEVADLPSGVLVGDLSAHLIDCINPAVNLFRVPDKATALMPDWERKLPALVEAAAKADITNISGVPSWFLMVLRGVLERTGASTVHDVWPNLEVFFHGGIAFGPYREQYASITDPSKMHYVETYNASEGFFAVQDTPDSADGMLLLARDGVFYEFLPVDNTAARPVPSWEVEKGRTYALVITACNGLWRYLPGDTLRIESTEPLRVSIAGRIGAFINAFGEELMVWNADAALSRACAAAGARIADYTAAPVYAAAGTRGRHQWLVEWETPPADIPAFTRELDKALQEVNSDYQAKRAGGIFLDPPEVVSLPRGTFSRWLAATGKLGGQRKVPRLANNRRIADVILQMIQN